MISVMKGSHYLPTTKSTLFAVSKDTNEDMVRIPYVDCGMPKGTSQAEVMSNGKK